MALLDGIAPEMLAPPLNVLRLSMHPQGLLAGSSISGNGRPI
jgi:hypothetical protein